MYRLGEFRVVQWPVPDEHAGDFAIEGFFAGVLDCIAFLAYGHAGGICGGIDGKIYGGNGFCGVHEEREFYCASPGVHAPGNDVELPFFEDRAGELGVIFIEAAESAAVPCSPPERVVVIHTAPDAFVFLAVAEISEKRIHILHPDPLFVHGNDGDPSMAFPRG